MEQILTIAASALGLASAALAFRRPTIPHMFAAAAVNAMLAWYLLR